MLSPMIYGMIRLGSNMRKRRAVTNHANKKSHLISHTTHSSPHHASELFDDIRAIISSSWNMKWDLLASFSSFFITLVVFVIFVHWNGSIVVQRKLMLFLPILHRCMKSHVRGNTF
ncbi:unnamed protein product [Cuscuta epithymum]|uniref:Dol-P-Glc:Glc(2)Man(9)GlcNAc(2)-PP-Dol alpha-1,2-glucosyltransferase n=1 Tax=Cuscuta epithymum TaxID=186058 RepID=A0AAV0DH19_9ASTE|nr:unnamed protein product [Cuscuta epithymum]CAH9144443.1 unnamed protein product [Cuscuta epithymum]